MSFYLTARLEVRDRTASGEIKPEALFLDTVRFMRCLARREFGIFELSIDRVWAIVSTPCE